MSQQAGLRVIPVAVTTAVIVVAAYLFFPFHRTPVRLGQVRVVTVEVTFDPPVRENCPQGNGRVTVSWSVGAQQHPLETICRSGWARTAEANGGQVVQVWVTQYSGIQMSCKIQQIGFEPLIRPKAGPGHITCRYVVR